MRRGQKVWEGAAVGVETQQLAAEMVGDTALLSSRRARRQPGEPVLRLEDVSVRASGDGRSLHQVSLVVRQHEILGIAGVVGNGQRESARAAAGLIEPAEGRILRPGSVADVADDRSMTAWRSTWPQ